MTVPNRANHPNRKIGGFVGSLVDNVKQKMADAQDTRVGLKSLAKTARAVAITRGVDDNLHPFNTNWEGPKSVEEFHQSMSDYQVEQLKQKGVSPKRIARAVKKGNKPLSPRAEEKAYQQGANAGRDYALGESHENWKGW